MRRLITALFMLGTTGSAEAARCGTGANTKSPPPVPLPVDRLVAHVETIRIKAPLATVLASAEAARLEDAIPRQKGLPYVTGTRALTPGAFDYAGARRIVCLSDGSTLTEQLLETRKTASEARFRYIVWNYTSATARPVRYGVGEFVRTALPRGETDVRWTYAFKMDRTRFPGFLGFVGDWLFRWSFLDADYAQMMRATLAAGKRDAETLANAGKQ
ncbi:MULTISPECIES: hypothetical protein [Sphingomonas]|uniref:hypothetical protein n=1 Tax=Sphingomonas TaxID=13687 RepID=UPI00082E34B8|nr:hypothetical protein [Sphingomonas sp. CCH10-B3]